MKIDEQGWLVSRPSTRRRRASIKTEAAKILAGQRKAGRIAAVYERFLGGRGSPVKRPELSTGRPTDWPRVLR